MSSSSRRSGRAATTLGSGNDGKVAATFPIGATSTTGGGGDDGIGASLFDAIPSFITDANGQLVMAPTKPPSPTPLSSSSLPSRHAARGASSSTSSTTVDGPSHQRRSQRAAVTSSAATLAAHAAREAKNARNNDDDEDEEHDTEDKDSNNDDNKRDNDEDYQSGDDDDDKSSSNNSSSSNNDRRGNQKGKKGRGISQQQGKGGNSRSTKSKKKSRNDSTSDDCDEDSDNSKSHRRRAPSSKSKKSSSSSSSKAKSNKSAISSVARVILDTPTQMDQSDDTSIGGSKKKASNDSVSGEHKTDDHSDDDNNNSGDDHNDDEQLAAEVDSYYKAVKSSSTLSDVLLTRKLAEFLPTKSIQRSVNILRQCLLRIKPLKKGTSSSSTGRLEWSLPPLQTRPLPSLIHRAGEGTSLSPISTSYGTRLFPIRCWQLGDLDFKSSAPAYSANKHLFFIEIINTRPPTPKSRPRVKKPTSTSTSSSSSTAITVVDVPSSSPPVRGRKMARTRIPGLRPKGKKGSLASRSVTLTGRLKSGSGEDVGHIPFTAQALRYCFSIDQLLYDGADSGYTGDASSQDIAAVKGEPGLEQLMPHTNHRGIGGIRVVLDVINPSSEKGLNPVCKVKPLFGYGRIDFNFVLRQLGTFQLRISIEVDNARLTGREQAIIQAALAPPVPLPPPSADSPDGPPVSSSSSSSSSPINPHDDIILAGGLSLTQVIRDLKSSLEAVAYFVYDSPTAKRQKRYATVNDLPMNINGVTIPLLINAPSIASSSFSSSSSSSRPQAVDEEDDGDNTGTRSKSKSSKSTNKRSTSATSSKALRVKQEPVSPGSPMSVSSPLPSSFSKKEKKSSSRSRSAASSSSSSLPPLPPPPKQHVSPISPTLLPDASTTVNVPVDARVMSTSSYSKAPPSMFMAAMQHQMQAYGNTTTSNPFPLFGHTPISANQQSSSAPSSRSGGGTSSTLPAWLRPDDAASYAYSNMFAQQQAMLASGMNPFVMNMNMGAFSVTPSASSAQASISSSSSLSRPSILASVSSSSASPMTSFTHSMSSLSGLPVTLSMSSSAAEEDVGERISPITGDHDPIFDIHDTSGATLTMPIPSSLLLNTTSPTNNRKGNEQADDVSSFFTMGTSTAPNGSMTSLSSQPLMVGNVSVMTPTGATSSGRSSLILPTNRKGRPRDTSPNPSDSLSSNSVTSLASSSAQSSLSIPSFTPGGQVMMNVTTSDQQQNQFNSLSTSNQRGLKKGRVDSPSIVTNPSTMNSFTNPSLSMSTADVSFVPPQYPIYTTAIPSSFPMMVMTPTGLSSVHVTLPTPTTSLYHSSANLPDAAMPSYTLGNTPINDSHTGLRSPLPITPTPATPGGSSGEVSHMLQRLHVDNNNTSTPSTSLSSSNSSNTHGIYANATDAAYGITTGVLATKSGGPQALVTPDGRTVTVMCEGAWPDATAVVLRFGTIGHVVASGHINPYARHERTFLIPAIPELIWRAAVDYVASCGSRFAHVIPYLTAEVLIVFDTNISGRPVVGYFTYPQPIPVHSLAPRRSPNNGGSGNGGNNNGGNGGTGGGHDGKGNGNDRHDNNNNRNGGNNGGNGGNGNGGNGGSRTGMTINVQQRFHIPYDQFVALLSLVNDDCPFPLVDQPMMLQMIILGLQQLLQSYINYRLSTLPASSQLRQQFLFACFPYRRVLPPSTDRHRQHSFDSALRVSVAQILATAPSTVLNATATVAPRPSPSVEQMERWSSTPGRQVRIGGSTDDNSDGGDDDDNWIMEEDVWQNNNYGDASESGEADDDEGDDSESKSARSSRHHGSSRSDSKRGRSRPNNNNNNGNNQDVHRRDIIVVEEGSGEDEGWVMEASTSRSSYYEQTATEGDDDDNATDDSVGDDDDNDDNDDDNTNDVTSVAPHRSSSPSVAVFEQKSVTTTNNVEEEEEESHQQGELEVEMSVEALAILLKQALQLACIRAIQTRSFNARDQWGLGLPHYIAVLANPMLIRLAMNHGADMVLPSNPPSYDAVYRADLDGASLMPVTPLSFLSARRLQQLPLDRDAIKMLSSWYPPLKLEFVAPSTSLSSSSSSITPVAYDIDDVIPIEEKRATPPPPPEPVQEMAPVLAVVGAGAGVMMNRSNPIVAHSSAPTPLVRGSGAGVGRSRFMQQQHQHITTVTPVVDNNEGGKDSEIKRGGSRSPMNDSDEDSSMDQIYIDTSMMNSHYRYPHATHYQHRRDVSQTTVATSHTHTSFGSPPSRHSSASTSSSATPSTGNGLGTTVTGAGAGGIAQHHSSSGNMPPVSPDVELALLGSNRHTAQQPAHTSAGDMVGDQVVYIHGADGRHRIRPAASTFITQDYPFPSAGSVVLPVKKWWANLCSACAHTKFCQQYVTTKCVLITAITLLLMTAVGVILGLYGFDVSMGLGLNQPVETPFPKWELASFPGAEGHGTDTEGGRGGAVWVVSNLGSNGEEGSLQWAIDQPGTRTIVFDVQGVIESDIWIDRGDLTIAGQTSPGVGITIHGSVLIQGGLSTPIGGIILRHLRIRANRTPILPDGADTWSPEVLSSYQRHALMLYAANNIVLDHLTLSWSQDSILYMEGCQNVTLQWSTLEEPMLSLYDTSLPLVVDQTQDAGTAYYLLNGNDESAAALMQHKERQVLTKSKVDQHSNDQLKSSTRRYDSDLPSISGMVPHAPDDLLYDISDTITADDIDTNERFETFASTSSFPEGDDTQKADYSSSAIVCVDSSHLTFHHNLIAHASRAGPQVDGSFIDVRNNVFHDYNLAFYHSVSTAASDQGISSGDGDIETKTKIVASGINIIGNYYSDRRWSGGGSQPMLNSSAISIDKQLSYIKYRQFMYFGAGMAVPFVLATDTSYSIMDNYVEGVGAVDDPWLLWSFWSALDKWFFQKWGLNYAVKFGQQHDEFISVNPPVTTHTSGQAYDQVLAYAGAFPRDTITIRVVNEVRHMSGWQGRAINDTISNNVTSTLIDEDGDGVPDSFEKSLALTLANISDSDTITPSGYSIIELWTQSEAKLLLKAAQTAAKSPDLTLYYLTIVNGRQAGPPLESGDDPWAMIDYHYHDWNSTNRLTYATIGRYYQGDRVDIEETLTVSTSTSTSASTLIFDRWRITIGDEPLLQSIMRRQDRATGMLLMPCSNITIWATYK
jgi:hypothetical protein